MPDINIKIVPTDHPDLIQLVDELNTFFVAEWGEDVNSSYSKHHTLSKMNTAVVAYVDNSPVGCGCWKLIENNMPEIKRMYVKEAYRGHQISQKILAKLEEDILSVGFKQAVLETGSEMNQAIRFYEKQGYKIVPNFGEFVGDDLCTCLAKDL